MDRPNLDITHLVASARLGGVANVVSALAAGMVRRGHQVRVVSLTATSPRLALLRSEGIEIHELGLGHQSYRREIHWLREHVAQYPGTILHSHGVRADLVGYAAARRLAGSLVSTAHGFTGGSPVNRWSEWLGRRVMREFDAVIAVSRRLRARLLRARISPARLHLIPNAYLGDYAIKSREEARRILEIPQDRLVAGWIGRLSHEKGPDLMLRALTEATEWHVSVIGSGPMLHRLQARSRELGVAPRVRWHGAIPEAGTLLRAFDAFLLSSRTEGTPLTILEAMAAGVPLVVMSVGGVPDVVTDREADLVPLEIPTLLPRVLQRVKSEPEVARAKVRAAHERLQAFYQLEPWLERYENIYRRMAQ